MGAIIGDSSIYPTWGRLRSPLLTNDTLYTLGAFNKEWQNGLRTIQGNGLLRTDPTFPYSGSPSIGLDAGNQFRLFSATSWIVLDDQDASYLIGATVLGTSGTLTITSDYLTVSGQTPPLGYAEPILAMSGLGVF